MFLASCKVSGKPVRYVFIVEVVKSENLPLVSDLLS